MGTGIERYLKRDDEPKKEKPREFSIDEFLAQERGVETRATTAARVGPSNPERSQKVLSLQAQTGLDHGILDRNLDSIDTRIWRDDFEPLARTAGPIVKGWLSENPHHVAAAAKDLSRLNWLERYVQKTKDAWERGMRQQRVQALAKKAMAEQITPEEDAELDSLVQHEEPDDSHYNLTPRALDAMIGMPGGALARFGLGIVPAVAEQIPVQLKTVAGALQGASMGTVGGAAILGPPGAAAGAVAGALVGAGNAAREMETYASYAEFRRLKDEAGEPISKDIAKAAAIVYGIGAGAVEMFELSKVTKYIPGLKSLGRNAVKTALRQPSFRRSMATAAKDMSGTALWEGGTEGVQQLMQNTSGIVAQMVADGSVSRFSTAELYERLSEGIVESMVMGAQAGIGFAGAGHIITSPREIANIRRAKQSRQFFEALGNVTKDSDLAAKLPAKLEEVVERMTKDGPIENIYISTPVWNELFQSQNADPAEVAAEVTGSATAYEEARTSGELAIPTSKYAAHIAPTEMHAKLVNELRLGSPLAMNARETASFVEEMNARETAVEAPRIVYRGAPSNEFGRGDFPGTFTAQERETAAQYGPVHAYEVVGEQKILDSADPQLLTLAREFEAVHGERSFNLNVDLAEEGADLTEGLMFPSPEWVAFLKEKGYTGTQIGKEEFFFDATSLRPADRRVASEAAFVALRPTLLAKMAAASAHIPGVSEGYVEAQVEQLERVFTNMASRSDVPLEKLTAFFSGLNIGNTPIAEVAATSERIPLAQRVRESLNQSAKRDPKSAVIAIFTPDGFLETHTEEEMSESDYHHSLTFSSEAMQRHEGGGAMAYQEGDSRNVTVMVLGEVTFTGEQIAAMVEKAGLPTDGRITVVQEAVNGEDAVTELDRTRLQTFTPITRSLNQAAVSTRVPTAVRATEDPHGAEPLVVGLESSKMDPKAFDKNAQVINQYPNMRPVRGKKANTADAIVERFISAAVDNLLWLYDQVTPEVRERSKLWYVGGRKIVDRWAAYYGLKDSQIAGVIAVLSPQTEWFVNMSRAKRVLDIVSTKQSVEWTDEMAATAMEIFADAKFEAIRNAIFGRTLGELSDLIAKAAWVRVYDEAHNDRSYPLITPEGNEGDIVRNQGGKTATSSWGSLSEIGKAISIIEDSSIRNLSTRLGGQHKVRSFYNNLFDPFSEMGDVTIDTHAVAAALLRPLSGSSTEVSHNFGMGGISSSSVFGSKGTYGLYAEAYRRAAAERGVLPRELQSITWEALRGLFSATFKSQSTNVEAVDAVWNQYRKGKIDLAEARRRTLELAGGITDPEWVGSATGVDEAEPGAADAGTVSGAGVPRGRAKPAAGRVAGLATRDPQELAAAENPQYAEPPARTEEEAIEGMVQEAEIAYGSLEAAVEASDQLAEVVQEKAQRTHWKLPVLLGSWRIPFIGERLDLIRKATTRAFVDIRGIRIRKVDDVYRVLSTFRDPTKEKLHILLLKNGEIVSHEMRTSGAINYVAFADRYAPDIIQRARRLGATSAILSHNHPSGRVAPSGDDMTMTAHMGWKLQQAGIRLDGHAVLNHNEMSWIAPGATGMGSTVVKVSDKPMTKARDKNWVADPRMRIDTPAEVMNIIHENAPDGGGIHILYMDTQHQIIALEPRKNLKNAKVWLPQQMRAIGAHVSIIVGDYDDVKHLKKASEMPRGVVDVIFQGRTAIGARTSTYHSFGAAGMLPVQPVVADSDFRMSRRLRESAPLPYHLNVWIDGAPFRAFSALERAIATAPFEKGTPEQWLAAISKGVTQNERTATGIDEFLRERVESGPKTLTRAEVAEYATTHRIALEKQGWGSTEAERVLLHKEMEARNAELITASANLRTYLEDQGVDVIKRNEIVSILKHLNLSILNAGDLSIETLLQSRFISTRITAKLDFTHRSFAEFMQAAEAFHRAEMMAEEAMANKAPYSEYTMPGGTNYRIIAVLHHPKRTAPELTEAEGDELLALWEAQKGVYRGEGYTPGRTLTRAEEARYNELRAKQRASTAHIFSSGHQLPENTMVHLRVTDRVGVNGEQILFIEEIQSDWHEQGRKRGYGKRLLSESEQARKRNLEELLRQAKTHAKESERSSSPDPRNVAFWQGKVSEYTLALQELATATTGIPDAPFKKTGEWVELAFKTILEEAVRGGYDSIAWTTGDQQNERYDLSPLVDQLEYYPDHKVLVAFPTDRNSDAREFNVEPSELATYVGEGLAAELLQQPLDESTGFYEEQSHQLALEDATSVGGEGMRGFYDRMLPQILEKLLKKIGATATKVTAEVIEFPRILDEGELNNLSEEENAEALALDDTTLREVGLLKHAAATGVQPALRLTPEVKAAVSRGMTLFQPAYHGSPHRFDKFSLHHIGTGEGASAYGWGLYFSSKKEVAAWYRDQLSGPRPITDWSVAGLKLVENGKYLQPEGESEMMQELRQAILSDEVYMMEEIDAGNANAGGDRAARGVLFHAIENFRASWDTTPEEDAFLKDLSSKVRDGDWSFKLGSGEGHIYKVDIPSDDTMLLEDSTIEKQPKAVQDLVRKILKEKKYLRPGDNGPRVLKTGLAEWAMSEGQGSHETRGGDIYYMVQKWLSENEGYRGQEGNEERASRYLASLGISGIKYKADQIAQRGFGTTYNYVIFDDALIKILDLEQGAAEEAPRGRIQFGEGQINIDLLAGADLSTFIHETGHFYMEMMQQLAPTSPSVKRDLDILRGWVGAAEGAELTREQHERIARGYEAYLMEGKAPTPALQGTFSRMKAWMLMVYRSVKSLNVDLTDEVRGVFDRLVASDEEIEEARKGLTPLFADPESIGMTASTADEYRRAVDQAREAARDELEQKALADVKREHTRAWQDARAVVRAQVAEEVNADPMWRALSILQRGKLPDGTPLPEGMSPIKLDRDSIVQMYDGDRSVLQSLPRPYVYAKEGGIHPDQAAELLGYESGMALLKALPGPGSETAQARVERLTDERMKAEHGDLLNDGRMMEEAQRAVHNVERSRLLRLELEHLASDRLGAFKGLVRRVTRRIPTSDAVRLEAEKFIDAKSNRHIRPHEYLAGERKAAKAAQEALLRGDLDLAFREKLNELVNHERYRAASKARQENDAWVKYLRRFQTDKVRAVFGKAGGPYLEQIDALLERFELSPVSDVTRQKRETLLEFTKANPSVDIPEYLLNEAHRVNYLDVTHGELRDLRDTVVQIAHLVRLKTKLLRALKVRDREEAAVTIAGEIVAHAKGTRPPSIETHLPAEERKRSVDEWFWGHRKYASIWRQLSGFVEGSAAWELMVRPLNDAANDEALENERAAEELDKIFGIYTAAEKRDMYEPQPVDGTSITMSKMGRLMVALNWGNETNKKRLIDGYAHKGYTEKTFQAVIDSLDERDWRFVQSTWAYLDTYWPRLEALGKDLYGLPPVKVAAVPIQTRFGEVRGGYLPIAFDDRQSSMAWKHAAEQMAERIKNGGAIRSTTEKGMLKERVEGNVRGELRLDFNVIFGHVAEVIHTVTHTAVLSDINSILSHEAVNDAIKSHYGDVVYKQLAKTLNDVAVGDVGAQNGFERAISWLRQGSTIVGLGYSFTTSLLQPFGLSNSIARIGARWVGVGVKAWVTDPLHTVENVHAKSTFMRLRHKTMMREINEIQNSLGQDGKVAGWVDEALEKITRDKVTRRGIADSFFWMIGRAQMVADVPTWVGAYEKALSEDADEATAVARADQAVLDSQGGGQVKDLSEFQRGGPLLRLFTNFYSYFNVVYNQLAEAKGKADLRDPASIGRLACDFLLVITIPSALAMVLRDSVKGGEDDEPWWKNLGKEHLSALLGTMLLTRELTGFAQGYFNYSGPAGSRIFGEVGRFIRQAEQRELDPAFWKSLNKVSGILFHYPAGAVERFVRGLAAMKSGDTNNPLSLLFGPQGKSK